VANGKDAELLARFSLDRIVHAARLQVLGTVYLDGPLARITGFAPKQLRIGDQVHVPLPNVAGHLDANYEVIDEASGDDPAKLRFVGLADDHQPRT
jgi:hypothetical protein